MQHLVDTYQCEWKTCRQKIRRCGRRFRTFVNSDATRCERMVFVQERGQIRPARAEERVTDEAVAS